MRLHRLVLPSIMVATLALGGCGQKAAEPSATATETADALSTGPTAPAGLLVDDATVKLPAVAGNPGVAYFTLSQSSGPAQKVVAVHVDGFERAEIHESRTEGGVSTMAKVDSVTVSPDKPAEFKPGGFHVMLFDAKNAPKVGDTVEITLTLDNGDKISASAKVEGAGDDGMAGMDHM
ncbi:copper chaperone PCu(A)C [Novosphingobium sp.]|uniref:copper chaperone PCu(A)C n=1 Tax=Novosphingobium sp. TaxID=1874826 RepID=UPI0038BD8988